MDSIEYAFADAKNTLDELSIDYSLSELSNINKEVADDLAGSKYPLAQTVSLIGHQSYLAIVYRRKAFFLRVTSLLFFLLAIAFSLDRNVMIVPLSSLMAGFMSGLWSYHYSRKIKKASLKIILLGSRLKQATKKIIYHE